jgi:hypothetical protein
MEPELIYAFTNPDTLSQSNDMLSLVPLQQQAQIEYKLVQSVGSEDSNNFHTLETCETLQNNLNDYEAIKITEVQWS